MTGKIAAISVLFLWVFVITVNPCNAGDYTQNIRAMEHRMSQMEMTMKELSESMTKDAEGTLGFYQETEAAMKRLSVTMDLLERRMSEAENRQIEFKALNSRAADLEARIPELENRWAQAKERKAHTSELREKAERSRRPPRSEPTLRVFIFDVRARGGRTEIRYYTTRDISEEDIRLPAYLIRSLRYRRR